MYILKYDFYLYSKVSLSFFSVLVRIQDITIGQYAPRESIVHRLDPRTKMLSSLFLMILLLITRRMEFLIIFFVALLFLFVMSKLSLGLALRNLRPFIWLFLLTFFLHGIFTKGRILWELPYLRIAITEEGIYKGLFYSFRIGILVTLASFLTLTTSPMSLTDAIERFLSPFRRLVPTNEIAMMMSISLRFIPIIIDEAERIRKTQISRGGCFEGNILRRIRNIVSLIIPLFLSTFRRANDLALAMDARCYSGGDTRTSYHILQFRNTDMIALFIVFLLGFPAIFIR